MKTSNTASWAGKMAQQLRALVTEADTWVWSRDPHSGMRTYFISCLLTSTHHGIPQPHIRCKILHPCFKNRFQKTYTFESLLFLCEECIGLYEKKPVLFLAFEGVFTCHPWHMTTTLIGLPLLPSQMPDEGDLRAQHRAPPLDTHTGSSQRGSSMLLPRLRQLCKIPMLGPLGRKAVFTAPARPITPPAKMPSSVIAAGCGWSWTHLRVCMICWQQGKRAHQLLSTFLTIASIFEIRVK